MEDAKKDLEAGQYRQCLQKVSKLLVARTAVQDSADRYNLLMMRGECLLQMKQASGAEAAFNSASSVMKSQADVASAASAHAVAVLIDASPDLSYHPAAPADAPAISILDAASRKKAMLAITEDRKKALTPKVEGALKDSSLASSQQLLPDLWDLYCVQFAATGDAADTLATLKSVGTHARELIEAELKRSRDRVAAMNESAGQPNLAAQDATAVTLRGLTPDERTELQKMSSDLEKITSVCHRGRLINRRFGGTGENWDTLLADCSELRDEVQSALAAR